jgi:hypothetical protein
MESTNQVVSRPKAQKAALDALPEEILTQIMSYLKLTSRCLSQECKSCDVYCWGMASPIYLDLGVLHVNRRLYETGIAILYGKNRLTMDCDLEPSWPPQVRIFGPHSPILQADFDLVKRQQSLHASECIRDLRVLQQFAAQGAKNPSAKSVRLFNQIRHLGLKSLHVLISQDFRDWEPRDYTLEDLKTTLIPLRLLRGIQDVKITESWFRWSSSDGTLDDPEVLSAVEAEKQRIIELIQGDSKVEEIEGVEEDEIPNPWQNMF